MDLKRGYAEVDGNYRSLLDKKFKAKMSENLEVAQKGEQFTILDHARVPDKPFKPQKRKILLMGVLLALSAGFGLAVLLEYLDASFFYAKDLESSLQFSILASIPVIMTEKDRQRTFVKRVAATAALLFMGTILLVALYFTWKMDPMATQAALS